MELVLIFLVTVNALILLAMAWLGLYPIIEPMLPRGLKNMFSFFARHAVWMFSLLAVGGVGTIIAIGVLTYKVNQKADEKMENVQNTLNSIAQKLYPDLPLSEALEKLKKLETRTSTLEQKTAPRSLTPEQRTQLITRLSPYKGQNIVITSVMSDSEAMNFAYVFKDVFEEAGWVVNKGWSFSIGNAPISGIQIDVVSEESSLKEAEIIYDALKAVGLEVTGHQIPNQKANKVTLIIGSKRQQ